MSFKDRMIEAEERGFTTADDAYEYVREQMADAADRRREPCQCVYPDKCFCEKPNLPVFMVGDRVLWDDGDEMGEFQGVVTRADFGLPYVMVKLDAGGTFRAERRHLRRA